jgi:hypothetical protein
MKLKSILVVVLFVFWETFGQQGNAIPLQVFSELKVYDRITVTLEKSNINALLVHGNNAFELQRTENGELLKLRIDPDQGAINSELNATLYFTGPLKLISAETNAFIQNKGTLKGESCELQAQDGGMIKLALAMTHIKGKAVSGGTITLSGSCAEQEMSVNTAGSVLNKELISKETAAVAMNGGLVEANATELIQAQTKAGGTIRVYGKPKKKVKDTTYGGVFLLME